MTAATRPIGTPSIYTVAVAGAPEIICPSWCVISKGAHLADLRDHEGWVIHWSDFSADVRHSEVTTPAGAPNPTEAPLVFVDHHLSDGISLDRAEQVAAEILAAVKVARS
jgi:hypothetical protein